MKAGAAAGVVAVVGLASAAGDAWIDPSRTHEGESKDGALASATGPEISGGEPSTEWAEPVDC
ncbi:hypothetical protein [Natronococcus sp.]|uniref:hypothetical protein n=1 Tax=Natronococcus sp. TaxID=35747 RepID=UPI003A4D2DCB